MTLEQRVEYLEGIIAQLVKSDRYTVQRTTQLFEGRNIQLGTASGTQIGTAANQKVGFLGATPVVQQTGGAATASGTYGPGEENMLNRAYQALRVFGLIS